MKTIMTIMLVAALIVISTLAYVNGQETIVIELDASANGSDNETPQVNQSDVLNETAVSPETAAYEAALGCTDSDGGALSYQGGHVSENGVIYDDYCSGSNVVEYTCKDGAAQAEEMPCMRGCTIDYQGYGQCKPTSGGRSQLIPTGTGPSSQEPTDIPEFNTIAAMLAVGISGAGYVFMRQSRRG